MSFASIKRSFWRSGGTRSLHSSIKLFATSARAAPRPSAVTSNSVIGAAIRSSPTTRAAIGIARSVSSARGRSGLTNELKNFFRLPIFTSSSRCPPPLALQNQKVIYNLLFRAASETLLEIAADRKHLGARIGFLAVLHTWGQNLHHHPHLHCVAPGGGISLDGSRWICCRNNFFLPVRVLSRLFRGKFLAFLREADQQGQLSFFGTCAHLREPSAFQRFAKRLKKSEWVVYSKPPFGGPEQVLKYLSRYTHRVAISNSRLISLDNGQVSFRWRNYRNDQIGVMTIGAVEFLRRFLQHVLPPGFVKIRHFGWLANRCRKDKLAHCRRLLSVAAIPTSSVDEPTPQHACPVCHIGFLRIIGCLAAVSLSQATTSQPIPLDSS